MLKAVIFDMDGVLVDSEPQHAKAAILALKKFGVDLDIDYCFRFIGSTTEHMLNTMIQDNNLLASVDELEEAYFNAKKQLIQEEGYTAIPYTKELLSDLYHNDVILAIASSSTTPEINDVVKNLDISHYFDILISGANVPHPKPAPDVFLKAVEEIGVDKSECIIIEDSHFGVLAAKAAGIPVIGYANENSGKQDLSKACMIVEGFDEIDYNFINNCYLRANNKPITILSTNRLVLKELAIEDIPRLYEIYQKSDVREFIDDMADNVETEIEKHKAYIRNIYHFYGYGLWGVFKKQTGELIGRCGIQNNSINGTEEIELGYLLDSTYWGNGYAVECVNAVLDYAANELQINRIVALIHPHNARSIKVAEHVGMKKECEVIKDGQKLDLYSIENIGIDN